MAFAAAGALGEHDLKRTHDSLGTGTGASAGAGFGSGSGGGAVGAPAPFSIKAYTLSKPEKPMAHWSDRALDVAYKVYQLSGVQYLFELVRYYTYHTAERFFVDNVHALIATKTIHTLDGQNSVEWTAWKEFLVRNQGHIAYWLKDAKTVKVFAETVRFVAWAQNDGQLAAVQYVARGNKDNAAEFVCTLVEKNEANAEALIYGMDLIEALNDEVEFTAQVKQMRLTHVLEKCRAALKGVDAVEFTTDLILHSDLTMEEIVSVFEGISGDVVPAHLKQHVIAQLKPAPAAAIVAVLPPAEPVVPPSPASVGGDNFATPRSVNGSVDGSVEIDGDALDALHPIR